MNIEKLLAIHGLTKRSAKHLKIADKNYDGQAISYQIKGRWYVIGHSEARVRGVI